VLVADLESEKSSHQLRRWTVEELVIRYGCDGPLETDMFVTQQKQVIANLAGWAQAEGKRFREGAWYFAGQMLPG
jgi:hypothetical protein